MVVDVLAPPGVEPWWGRFEPGLDTPEEIVPPRLDPPPLGDCRSGARSWALFCAGTGEVRRARCKSPNRCQHCREVSVRETVEMLTLDAEESPPSVYVVLTCRDFLTRRELRRHLEHLRRSARRMWPSLEWFCSLEWQKRGAIHVNLLVKGVGAGADQLLLQVLWRVWRRRVDAVWEAQHAQPIRSVRRAVSYVAKVARYMSKPAQEPPPGWRGHRSSQTRGYLVRPASVMRLEARGSQRWKAVRGALRRAGLSRVESAWQAVAPAAFQALSVWSFVSRPVVPQPPVRVSPSVRPPPAGGWCPVASCDPPKQRTGKQPQQPLCDASGGEVIWGGRPHWVI